MNNTATLTGYEAIAYAEANGLTLNKYNDPTEDAREGVTTDEARKIAREDPGLIWIANREQLIRSARENYAAEVSALAAEYDASQEPSFFDGAFSDADMVLVNRRAAEINVSRLHHPAEWAAIDAAEAARVNELNGRNQ